MAKLGLSESRAVASLAECIYELLPGNANPYASQDISFAGVAASLGLQRFWPPGSKTPAIAALLQGTLEHERDKFCVLMEEIIKTSFKYKRGAAVTREEVDEINRLVKVVGFKVPSLWDQDFLRSLPRSTPAPPADLSKQIAELKNEYAALAAMRDPHARGFAFEKFLNKLFSTHGLEPRKSFKLEGQQIDGSIEMNSQIYLVEARWRDNQANYSDLVTFHGKIGEKSTWSRGIFISFSGFTDDGLTAFQKGRPTNLICFSGQDLYFVLENKCSLQEIIQQKMRLAGEEGCCYAPVFSLGLAR